MVFSYDAKRVPITYGGALLTSGFQDGDFLTLEKAQEDWLEKTGADGEITRSKVNNSLVNCKITVMQTSRVNDILSAARAADLAAPNGAPRSFVMRDLNGRTVVRGTAWIRKPPAAAYGREVGTREWDIAIDATEYTVGGSDPNV